MHVSETVDPHAFRRGSGARVLCERAAGEFNLLTAFLRSPQQILTREQLLAASRVHDEEVFDRSVDIQILRLRRKLEANPSEPQLIKTERGAGYIFAPSSRSCDHKASELIRCHPLCGRGFDLIDLPTSAAGLPRSSLPALRSDGR